MDPELAERLNEERGKPYIDIENGFTFGADVELTFIVSPEYTADIRRGDPLLVYDLRDEVWYGVEVREIQIMKTSTLDRERDLFAVDQDSIATRYQERGERFSDPSVVKVEPIASFEREQRRAPSKCPSSASILLDPKPTEEATAVSEEPGLRRILGLPEDGVPFGAVSINQRAKEVREGEDVDNPFLDFRLDLDTLSNQHAVVFGASGQGKTSFLKFASKQLLTDGYGIIFFDIQGDILQTLFDIEHNEEQEEILTNAETFSHRFHQQIGSDPGLPEDTDVTVYFPVTESTDDDTTAQINQLCQAADMGDNDVQFRPFSLRFRNVHSIGELAHYIDIASPQGQEVISEIVYNNPDLDLDQIIQIINEEASNLEDYDETAIPQIGVTTQYYQGTYFSANRALNAISRAGIYDVREEEEPDMYGNAGEYNIVYLSHLDQMEARHMVEKHVMGNMRARKERVQTPGVYILVDEAHEIVPAEGTTASPKQVVDRLIREFDKIAREGRKYNINLLVSTHYPSDIDDVVKNICDTRVVMGVSEDDARAADVPEEYQHDVSQLNQGYAYVNTASSTTSPWTQIRIPLTDLLHMDISEWGDVQNEIIAEDRDAAIDDEEEDLRDYLGEG